MNRLIAILLLFTYLLCGCQLTPTKNELSALATLQPGITKRSDVRKMFRVPWESETAGKIVDTYQLGRLQLAPNSFLAGHLARSPAVDVTTLTTVFDLNGTLESTNLHRWIGGERVQSFLVNRIGPDFNPENVARVQPGTTTIADLDSWFGPPVVLGPNAHGGRTARWFSTRHEYGGYIHFFRHQALVVELGGDDRVLSHKFYGELNPPKK